MFILNGKTLSPDTAFTVNDVQYPANWLRLASVAERESIGITEVSDPISFDDRFYWSIDNPKMLEDREEVDENGSPLYVKVLVNGEMVDSTERLVTKGLKSQWIAQFKDTTNKILSDTDWMIIRKVERAVDIPLTIVDSRTANLTECERLLSAITSSTSVEDLITVINTQKWVA